MKDYRHLYPKTLELYTGLSFPNKLYLTAFNLRTLAYHCGFIINVEAGQAVLDRYSKMAQFLERPGAIHLFGKQYESALITMFHKEWIEAAHIATKDESAGLGFVNHIETGPASDLVHWVSS